MTDPQLVRPVPVSGFPEWLPEIRMVEQKWLDLIRPGFERYGFCSIETPSVEPLSVLTAKGETSNEVYAFRGGGGARGEEPGNGRTGGVRPHGLGSGSALAGRGAPRPGTRRAARRGGGEAAGPGRTGNRRAGHRPGAGAGPSADRRHVAAACRVGAGTCGRRALGRARLPATPAPAAGGRRAAVGRGAGRPAATAPVVPVAAVRTGVPVRARPDARRQGTGAAGGLRPGVLTRQRWCGRVGPVFAEARTTLPAAPEGGETGRGRARFNALRPTP